MCAEVRLSSLTWQPGWTSCHSIATEAGWQRFHKTMSGSQPSAVKVSVSGAAPRDDDSIPEIKKYTTPLRTQEGGFF